jgi:hypothetical protein
VAAEIGTGMVAYRAVLERPSFTGIAIDLGGGYKGSRSYLDHVAFGFLWAGSTELLRARPLGATDVALEHARGCR